MVILSTAYLGNVQYYTHLVRRDRPVTIDIHEHYRKQSYRNRCDILGANGPVSLTIPVLKRSGEKTPVRDVRIDPSKSWRHQHWNSIESAYRNSPYFDFYGEELAPFYERKYDFLLDLNMELQAKILELAEIEAEFFLSERYVEPGEGDTDLRDALTPKARLRKSDTGFSPTPYYQVFSERYDFVPNLSILDLLFCEGLGTRQAVRDSRNDRGG